MTEQEMMKEALEWQEYIRELITVTDYELYHKRSKVFDWLINRVEELEARNTFLEKAHQTNIKIAEDAQKEIAGYKKAHKDVYWAINDLKFENLKLEQQNKRYREAIESMKSEINYALHSNKSKDVKRHYLENAVKYADKALEGEK